MTQSEVVPTVSDLARNFDHTNPHMADQLYEVMSEMREQCPVARSEALGGFWAVSRYEDVKAVALDTDRYKSEPNGDHIPRVRGQHNQIPNEIDAPRHPKFRRFLLSHFNPKAMAPWRATIEQITRDTLAPHLAKGELDLVADFSVPVPAIALGMLLGLPEADWPRFEHLSSSVLQLAAQGDMEAVMRVAGEIDGYLREAVMSRRGKEGDDLLTKVANVEIDGELLEEQELAGICSTLLQAGHPTTISAAKNIFAILATDAELRKQLIADPSLIPSAVEESLRFDAPVTCLSRTVDGDAKLGDAEVSDGDIVLMLWGSANRDDSVFERPDEFVLERPNINHHLTFGAGVHRCVGEHFARLELNAMVETVLREIPDFELVEGTEIQRMPGITREIVALPVTFKAH
ncbi:cytochrome P450 [Nocardioides sp. WS12]|uniref:cytochrome P450 n=1 Tax=Nocardioides sp. WS12 TaxID=2486272 RepID=UPI0015FD4002|nr:cytochrome P450 [Nocardioides sp. WS12]